jgi:hypothetical protein
LQAIAINLAFRDDTVIDEHDWDAPVVEIVEPFILIHVGQLRFVAERTEQSEGLVAEVAALAGDQNEPHGLAREVQGLAHLDDRALEPVGTLDVVDTDPHIIRRVVLGCDRPQRVPPLHDDCRVGLRAAAVSHDGEPHRDCTDRPQHRHGAAPARQVAAATGCPHLIDPVAGGVHTFDRIPNDCSDVKHRTKVCGWSPKVLRSSKRSHITILEKTSN